MIDNAQEAAAIRWRRIECAAAAYAVSPMTFQHLEWAWEQFRLHNPGRWPLAVHVHFRTTFVYGLDTDMAGSA